MTWAKRFSHWPAVFGLELSHYWTHEPQRYDVGEAFNLIGQLFGISQLVYVRLDTSTTTSGVRKED
jgi:hypothetical protein